MKRARTDRRYRGKYLSAKEVRECRVEDGYALAQIGGSLLKG